MHHPTDRITHNTAFVIPVVEHWLERDNIVSYICKQPSQSWRKFHIRGKINVVFGQNELVKFVVLFCLFFNNITCKNA